MKYENLNLNHNIYIVRAFSKDGKSMIKIGFSKNIKQRLDQYDNSNPFIELLVTFYSAYNMSYEKLIHSNLIPDHRTEWYYEDKLPVILSFVNKTDYKCYSDFTFNVDIDRSNELDTILKENTLKEMNKVKVQVEELLIIIDSIKYDYTNCLLLFDKSKYISSLDKLDVNKVEFLYTPQTVLKIRQAKLFIHHSRYYLDTRNFKEYLAFCNEYDF